MELTKITFEFMKPPPILNCMCCKTGKAELAAIIREDFHIYLCPDCAKLTENEILKRAINGGQTE